MDDLTLLRTLRNSDVELDDATFDRGLQALTASIATAPAQRQQAPRSRRARVRRTRWMAGAVAGATALTAAGLVTNIFVPVGLAGGASPAAAQTLQRAALATIRISDPVVGPGQYLAVHTTEQAAGIAPNSKGRNVAWLDTGNDTLYIPYDQHHTWVWNRGDRIATVFYDPSSRQVAATADGDLSGSIVKAANGAFYGTTAQYTPASMNSIPRNPRLLLAYIYASTIGQGSSRDGEALVWIADLLRTGLVPADLRATLFQTAALIPGVTITATTADLDGRAGVAIGRTDQNAGLRQDILIDPTTGELIGEREIVTRASDSIPAGGIFRSTTVTTTVTDRAIDTPR